MIRPNYLSREEDRRVLREGIRILRKIFAQESFARFRGDELQPGGDIADDDGLDSWIAQTASSVFHPVGTAKMGDDPMAVVDASLRLRGIDGCRVADASVMPTIVSANTNAATTMIAEKAADMILDRAPLAPVDPD